MKIGPFTISSPAVLAPMAGVTDLPFRKLCRRLGAALAVSEMVSANTELWRNPHTQRRLDHRDEPEPRSVQLLGNDPAQLRAAAQLNVARGAQIIDLNMGCPAKKVCHRVAGSALLPNEGLVRRIVEQVVRAVDVPVTLKIRTGWDPEHRNAVTIARIAEDAGIQALAVHGRTRACGYAGAAEYDTIAEIKARVAIPVIANGDIDTPEKAAAVLNHTAADAVMIGRGAQGRPWLFDQINRHLLTGHPAAPPNAQCRRRVIREHIEMLHSFYGPVLGVRIARKHIGWYLHGSEMAASFKTQLLAINDAQNQLEYLNVALVSVFADARMDGEEEIAA
ncbi:MAG: tRNA dihydrouridine synthase DusB [Thiotrichales bacterium]